MAAFLESRPGFGPALSIKARDQLSGPGALHKLAAPAPRAFRGGILFELS
jgi:hypothetical protein